VGQPAGGHDLDGLVDRDVGDARLLVDPSVAGQLLLLLGAKLLQVLQRSRLQTRGRGQLPRLLGETTQKEHPEIGTGLRARILATPPQGIADALAGLAARADSFPTLREIRVPTLVVCGAEDVLTPVADSEAIHKGVPGSRLEVIPRAGHLANLESPAAYNRALLSFLGGLASRS